MGEKHNMGQKKCVHCPHISTSEKEYRQHRRTHVGNKHEKQKCPQCEYFPHDKFYKAKHMWKEHGIVYKYKKGES